MSSKTFTQAIAELSVLPEDALTQVLTYIETLKRRYPSRLDKKGTITERYPLRGEVYTYLDPFEPAVPAEVWEANGEDR